MRIFGQLTGHTDLQRVLGANFLLKSCPVACFLNRE